MITCEQCRHLRGISWYTDNVLYTKEWVCDNGRKINKLDDPCPEGEKIRFNDWIQWAEQDPRLEDHYFYLVSDKQYATPMKAMYHDDCLERFDVFTHSGTDSVYFNDERITAWMPLPKKYEET